MPVAGSCEQAARQTVQTLEALNVRLEASRQTNSPSQMRAAMDDLQAALGSMKAQLSGCSVTTNAAGTMPGMQHGAQVSAAVPPSTAAPASPEAPPAIPAGEPSISAQLRGGPGVVTSSSRIDISLKTQPTPLKIGANQLEVTVRGADGKPFGDADVSVLLVMPAMPAMKMPEMRNEVKLKADGDGRYTGTGQVTVAGQWNVTVVVKQNGKEIGQKKMTLTSH